MTPEDIQKVVDGIIPKIQNTVVQTVNGKIDRIHKILESQNEIMDSFHTKVEKHIESDVLWKEKAKPVIDMGENMQGFGKVTLYFVGFVSAFLGAILLVKEFFKR